VLLTVFGLALIAVVACSQSSVPRTPTPWPEGLQIIVSDDIKIQFADPDTGLDYIASVFIRHSPSQSSVAVNQSGFISYVRINTDEARIALCEVLHDRPLMDEVKTQATELDTYTFMQGPWDNLPCDALDRPDPALPGDSDTTVDQPSADQFRIVYDRRDWPDEYRRRVNDDVEIQFAYPIEGARWGPALFVWHKSAGTVSVDIEGKLISIEQGVQDAAVAATCSILADKELISELIARAEEIGVAQIPGRLIEPDPCEAM